jgi:hypothetical protein
MTTQPDHLNPELTLGWLKGDLASLGMGSGTAADLPVRWRLGFATLPEVRQQGRERDFVDCGRNSRYIRPLSLRVSQGSACRTHAEFLQVTNTSQYDWLSRIGELSDLPRQQHAPQKQPLATVAVS